MQGSYTIRLDGKPGSPNKKFDCPYCRHKKCFRRYYNYQTREYVADECGACDRLNKCNYHFSPSDYYKQNLDKKETIKPYINIDPVVKPKIHLPFDVLNKTLQDYDKNSFIKPLTKLYPIDRIKEVISEYLIGTVKSGFDQEREDNVCVVFWFIDQLGNLRAGQIKLYDENIKTAKYLNTEGKKRNVQTWIHSFLIRSYKAQKTQVPQWLKDYADTDKVTCLFGEHLLNKHKDKVCVLVESPKSAIIGALEYPKYLWLSIGGLGYLTKERIKALKGRNVIVIPDLGIPNPRTGQTCFEIWQERISEFCDLANFQMDTLLETHATDQERHNGSDIADYLLSFKKDITVKEICIAINDIKNIPVTTKTGSDFGNLTLATIELKDRRLYDVLYDKSGELITTHPKLKELSTFFSKDFHSGKIGGESCLLNIVKN